MKNSLWPSQCWAALWKHQFRTITGNAFVCINSVVDGSPLSECDDSANPSENIHDLLSWFFVLPGSMKSRSHQENSLCLPQYILPIILLLNLNLWQIYINHLLNKPQSHFKHEFCWLNDASCAQVTSSFFYATIFNNLQYHPTLNNNWVKQWINESGFAIIYRKSA